MLSRKDRYKYVVEWFKENMPTPKSELNFTSPYQLVVAVILSAQCTDKRVNIVTVPFFERYPTAESLAQASVDDVFALIKSVSYPNNKAKNISAMAKMLVEELGGVLPHNPDELQKLPGVGRKTANVVSSILFDCKVIAVDTHVFRVAARIGLSVNAKTPLDCEQQLTKYFPRDLLPTAHHWLILHGRYICVARKPKCDQCGISQWCDFYQKNLQE